MKKLLIALVLCAVVFAPVFAQEEYTLYYSGDITGFVTIQKDKAGKITITQKVTFDTSHSGYGYGGTYIDNSICPLLPAKSVFGLLFAPDSIIIDGNTTTEIWGTDVWKKTVVSGNTTTRTSYDGSWEKTVVDGNTTMTTYSNGYWKKTVVNGNTTMATDSSGWWGKTVVDGNTTTGNGYKIVVDGNTTTLTNSDGYWEKTVVDGNTTMETASNGYWTKTVIDKQGHDIFITKTYGKK